MKEFKIGGRAYIGNVKSQMTIREQGLTIVTRFMEVTPELAKVWGDRTIHNTTNRNEKEYTITKLEKAQRGGYLQINPHAGPLFDKHGILIDGQNTLKSIVVSGKSQMLYVVTGLSLELVKYIDDGTPRSPTDQLVTMGVVKEKAQKVARLITRFNRIANNCGMKMGRAEIGEYWLKHRKEIESALKFIDERKDLLHKLIKTSDGLWTATCYLFRRQDSESYEQFIAELVSSSCKRRNATEKLRMSLNVEKDAKPYKGKHHDKKTMELIKAWNAFLSYDNKYRPNWEEGLNFEFYSQFGKYNDVK